MTDFALALGILWKKQYAGKGGSADNVRLNIYAEDMYCRFDMCTDCEHQ